MSQSALAFNATPSVFAFHTNSVRVVVINGEPWFIASDVAAALGYRDASNAARHLKEHQKGTHNLSTLGGDQQVTIINESGLYRLVLRSRKPEAEEFSDWVTGEVLPSIRKTGGYAKSMCDPARVHEAMKLATEAGQQITRHVYEALMSDKDFSTLASQWMLYFHKKHNRSEVDAYCKPLSMDSICLSPDDYLANLERGDGHMLNTEQWARMAELSTRKLAGHLRRQATPGMIAVS